ncbi:nuclease-related domain-containing protein [Phycicoccus sp. Soil748]|uniref:nuclease-related domain-containing protein n=1 Tax=Phycicoccus sp. Soil748 TaxID=1736397 RepID=UPI0012E36B0F|nr:nuclease-related domain-containing protein [Phycicoccus sp. Soil748]
MRTELWSGRRNIAAAAAWMLGGAVVVLVLPVGSGMVRGFVAGTLATSWAWMVFVTSLIRTYPVTMGEWGESFTREVLTSREFGWPFLDDVPMEKRNIDHVAVSPRAVLAMETKFVGAGRQWATDRYREVAMDGARSSARSVRSILLSQGFKDVPVEAVLMIWGPGAGQLENDWAVLDGVHVVRGLAAADEWRRHCNDGDISAARAKELHGILRSHQAMRDAHAGAKTRPAHASAGCSRPGPPRSRES